MLPGMIHGLVGSGGVSSQKKTSTPNQENSSSIPNYSPLQALPKGSADMINLVSGDTDDDSVLIPDIGFDLSFYGINYRNNIYVGLNSYIVFGISNSSIYRQLLEVPQHPYFFVASGDCSYQNVYFASDTDYFRIRFEGSTGTSSGTPPHVWEVEFFGNNAISLVCEDIGEEGGSNTATGTTLGAENITQIPAKSNNSYVIYLASTSDYYYFLPGSYVS